MAFRGVIVPPSTQADLPEVIEENGLTVVSQTSNSPNFLRYAEFRIMPSEVVGTAFPPVMALLPQLKRSA